VVLWCIHDYPALSTLFGWVMKGYFACVRCGRDPCSRRLKNKICYIGHHCFLPTNHPWRRKKEDFDGTIENQESWSSLPMRSWSSNWKRLKTLD
jgi:hypothetical protein